MWLLWLPRQYVWGGGSYFIKETSRHIKRFNVLMEILVSVQIDFLKISYLSDFGCSTSFGTGVIWWRLGSLILYISASHKLLCFLEATLNGRQERNEQNKKIKITLLLHVSIRMNHWFLRKVLNFDTFKHTKAKHTNIQNVLF
jgi:hypothetical protein